MTYLKRQEVPKKWPIPRKGTKYVVRADNLKSGIPILVVLRDILKLAKNRKEIKQAINAEHILINTKLVIDERKSILLFDTITIVPSRKSYRVELAKTGKFKIEEIKENEAGEKISKITDKKILKGKKTQLNLIDGKNFLSEIKCKTNDSVLINFKDKKVEKCLPLKENANAIVFDGKHAGKSGIIKAIKQEKKMAEIEIDGKMTNVLIKQFMVVE
mgnify:CR=1 FL=1